MTCRDGLASHLEQQLGLSFTGAQAGRMRAVVERLRDRAGVVSTASYQRLLKRDAGELDDLIDALTVGETHFFREPHGLAILQHQVLPQLAHDRQGDDHIQIWSAGCATGEEAYTIAMAATEIGLGGRVQVLGTDLSAHAIATARAGAYGRWSLRGVDADRQRAWFRHDGHRHHVHRDVHQGVRFRAMNLLDGGPGRFDVVVCRNVLMYFTPQALQRAAQVLHGALRPGGWLLTGASDPPLDIDGLARDGHSTVVYRRQDAVAEPPPTVPPPGQRPAPALRLPPVPPTVRPPAPDAATMVRALGGAGRRDDALAVAVRATADSPLDPELRYLSAVLHLEAGRLLDAAAAARAALFLDPNLDAATHILHHARQLRR